MIFLALIWLAGFVLMVVEIYNAPVVPNKSTHEKD